MGKFPIVLRNNDVTFRESVSKRATASTRIRGIGDVRASIIYDNREPRPLVTEVPAGIPFPTDSLGCICGPAARAIRARVQCPIEIAAQSVLAAGTVMSQGLADVLLPIGKTVPISNNFMTLAKSGERKTTADSIALRPIKRQESLLKSAFDRAQYDPAVAQLGLPLPFLLCPDTTVAGLVYLLQSSYPALGLFTSEGGMLLGGSAFKNSNLIHTISVLSKLWDDGALRQVRGNVGVIELKDRRLSAHIMIQPKIASKLLSAPALTDQGFLSRCLISNPESLIGTRLNRRMDAEDIKIAESDLNRYGDSLEVVFRSQLKQIYLDNFRLNPRVLRPDIDAADQWLDFADEVEEKLGPGGEYEEVVDLVNKIPEHSARVAAVLTLMRNSRAKTIPVDEMISGIELGRYYAHEMVRLHSAGVADPELAAAERLRVWLLKKRSGSIITLTDIYQNGPPTVRTAKAARKYVKTLEEYGWLVKVPAGDEGAGTEQWKVRNIVRRP